MDNYNDNSEFIELLMKEDIEKFNKKRLEKLTIKPNLSNKDFSGKNLSYAFFKWFDLCRY